VNGRQRSNGRALLAFLAIVALLSLPMAGPAYAATFRPPPSPTPAPQAEGFAASERVTAEAFADSPFADLEPGAAFYDDIMWLRDRGITRGAVGPGGTLVFGPADSITREAMAAFIYRFRGEPTFVAPDVSPFTDLAPGAAFYPEITWLEAEGIAPGKGDVGGAETFRPTDLVTRDVMAQWLYRALADPGYTAPATSPFVDITTAHPSYTEISWMATTGISTGAPAGDGTYRYAPGDPIRREAMAAFMHRAILGAGLDLPSTCRPAITLGAATETEAATAGDPIQYDLTLRNDPVGPCFAGPYAPTSVSGVLRLESRDTTDVAVQDVVAWLEIPASSGTSGVLPAASGLTTTGGPVPGGCPGGAQAGCGTDLGAIVGYVSLPGGNGQLIPSGGYVDVRFTYFPTLTDQDLENLRQAGPAAILAVAVTTSAGDVTVTRTAANFGEAPATEGVLVEASLPSGTETTTVSGVPAGGQVDLPAAFAYVVDAEDEVVSASFTASAGAVVSDTATVETVVIRSQASLPALQPAIWPIAATIGVPTSFTLSVSPEGEVSGAVTATWPGGSVAAVDDGTSGDLVADDGVWTAAIDWTPDSVGPASFDVTTSLDGVPATGSVMVPVYPVGVPTEPVAEPDLDTIADQEAPFLADRIIVYTAADATSADVEDAASTIGGTVVGLTGPGVWQVAIPPVTDRAGLTEILEQISGHPAVLGVEPETVSDLAAVKPSDPRFAEQTNLSTFGVDDAWVFQRGAERSVLVAVIDSGINTSHPDLDGKIVGGIDIRDGDNDPNDEWCLHGSHVAGIIAAESDNATGVAGINWGAKILPIKIFHPTAPGLAYCGQSTTSDLAAAIDYATSRGASVINLSLGEPTRSEAVAAALSRAYRAGRVVVAAAGNTYNSTRLYPAAYEPVETFTGFLGTNARNYETEVIAVGNIANDGTRAPSSTRGAWVDFAAPGVQILSTTGDTDPYQQMTGTSQAAPFVSGVVSLLLAENPNLKPVQVWARLYVSAKEDPRHQEVGRIIDAYQAVANAGFEVGTQSWQKQGTVTTPTQLGPIRPQEGSQMLSLSTGPDSAQVVSSLRRQISVPTSALTDGSLTVRLRYNYVTEEYPEYVGSAYNDAFTIKLTLPDGTTETLVSEAVNSTAWTPISGIDLPGGDGTVGQSNWRSAEVTIPGARLQGTTSIELLVTDVGDAIYDSVALVDAIEVS